MVLLKNSTRDFWNSPPFERSTCFYVTITGNFENFQYFNSEKKIRPFKKNGVLPVTTLFLRKICFSLRALFKEFIFMYQPLTRPYLYLSKSLEFYLRVLLAHSKVSTFLQFFGKPFKNDKKAFYFTLETLFVLKIFKYLPWLFGHVGKRLD